MLRRVAAVLKAHRDSERPLVRHGVRAAQLGWRAMLAVGALVGDEAVRSAAALRFWYRDRVHQTTPLTWVDRYPVLFAACRDHLGDGPERRILSYGCSTGEEVVTLRRYFPEAHLVGAEINRTSLRACRSRPVDERITFIHSSASRVARHGPYDAVFCMAVLQRTPHAVEQRDLKSLEGVYPFERFDRQLTALDAVLRPGGLLIVHHSQYLVADATVAGRYRPLEGVPAVPDPGPRFGRDSRRVPTPARVPSIYVKTA